VAADSEAAGKLVKDLGLPDGSLVIAIMRESTGFVPLADSLVEAGDEVLLVLDTGLEDRVAARFQSPARGEAA
jgi:trk system potassium uptake protein TrkA